MEGVIFDWLSVILRWLHVITGIAWIGASFYFIWLDNSLQTPPKWKQDKGIAGDLWAFHGGGIYEVGKYALAPPEMPETLHWFKWEAYATWITGTLLLCVIYYFRAEFYLIGPEKWLTSSSLAVTTSIVFILSGLSVYEILIRFVAPKNTPLFLGLLCSYLSISCWLATQLFADRAAFLHIGALMATIMAANVLLGIIPAQKGFIKAIEANKAPEKTSMLAAKTRSVHNNYFTLPVLFCMISNHYAFLYGHKLNWLILISIITITAYARHFFNLKHKGIIKPHILIVSIIAVFLLIAVMTFYTKLSDESKSAAATTVKTTPKTTATATKERLQALTDKHCKACHSKNPTMAGFSAAPAGIFLEKPQDFLTSKTKIITAVTTQYMPLGNISGMTDEERSELINLTSKLQ